MKLLRVLTQSFDLDRVIDALDKEGFRGATIAEVVHVDPTRHTRGTRGFVTLRNQLTLAVHDDLVERALRALHVARCKRELEVQIEPLQHAVRIRTGEVDQAAIWQ